MSQSTHTQVQDGPPRAHSKRDHRGQRRPGGTGGTSVPAVRQMSFYVDASRSNRDGAVAIAVGTVVDGEFTIVHVESLERGTSIDDAEAQAIRTAVDLIPVGMRGVIYSDSEAGICQVREDLNRETVLGSGLYAFHVQIVWEARNSHPYSVAVHEAAFGCMSAVSEAYRAELVARQGQPRSRVSLAFFRVDQPGFPAEVLAASVDTLPLEGWEMTQQVLLQPFSGDVMASVRSLVERAGVAADLLAGRCALDVDPSVPEFGDAPHDLLEASIINAAQVGLDDHRRHLLAVSARRVIEYSALKAPVPCATREVLVGRDRAVPCGPVLNTVSAIRAGRLRPTRLLRHFDCGGEVKVEAATLLTVPRDRLEPEHRLQEGDLDVLRVSCVLSDNTHGTARIVCYLCPSLGLSVQLPGEGSALGASGLRELVAALCT